MTALPIHRRRFLKWGLLAFSAFCLPRRAAGLPPEKTPPVRRLSFFNTHTGESLDTCYFRSGCYDRDALQAINHLLRDHRSGEVGIIDERLLDLLSALSRGCGHSPSFHVISGFRSPETNAALHRRSRGVASRSLHVHGMAIDIRVPGLKTCELRDLALSLASGGVGYYPGSDFVHVDIGRVRSW